MIEREKDGWRDVLLAAGCLLFALIMYAQTLDLPGPTYDPLGPAFLPRLLCIVIFAVSLVILFHGVRKFRAARQVPSATAASAAAASAEGEVTELPAFRRHPKIAAAAVAATFLYILALDIGLSGFRTLTVLFILALGTLLLRTEMKRFSLKHSLILAAIALAMGFGLYYLFTRVFIVNLY